MSHTLHMGCRNEFGMAGGLSSTTYIAERVLKEAHAVLKHTDWRIAQVAGGLGFDEPAYFANFFKKYNGSSPGNARMQYL